MIGCRLIAHVPFTTEDLDVTALWLRDCVYDTPRKKIEISFCGVVAERGFCFVHLLMSGKIVFV